jgi:hypothetical protein
MAADPKVVREAAEAQGAVNPPGSLDPAHLVESWKLYARFAISPATKGMPVGSMASSDWKTTLDVIKAYAGFQGSMNPEDYFTNDFVQK